MKSEQRKSSAPLEWAAKAHLERAEPLDEVLGRTLALVHFLRERCPWDSQQDPRSLRPYLLEEAHEVAEAIVSGDDEALAQELGDLLLNVAFQVVLAEERGAFDAVGVVDKLEEKMRVRHPHIYGAEEEPPDWEALKARERSARQAPMSDLEASPDPFTGVPEALEPLSRALRLQDRAAAVGFEWSKTLETVTKLEEEVQELRALLLEPRESVPSVEEVTPGHSPASARVAEEVGDLLFAAVAVARGCGVHPSNALLDAADKFQTRFRRIRRMAAEQGLEWETATPEELKELWKAAKQE